MSTSYMLVIGRDYSDQLELFADDGETPLFDAWGWYVCDGELERLPSAPARALTGPGGNGAWFDARPSARLPLDHVFVGDVDIRDLARSASFDAVIHEGIWHGYSGGLIHRAPRHPRVRRHFGDDDLRMWLAELLAELSADTPITLVKAHV
jgi:hypothetical protein